VSQPSIPRPEHPRPDLVRSRWTSLNGPWRFAFDPRGVGEHERWYRPGAPRPKDLTISVPFPWESRLSGVAAPEYKGAAWYEREIEVPADWEGDRAFLHVGAIDWSARVWLDGRLVAEHDNGYLPLSCDLSPYLRPGRRATLTVRAFDVSDAATPLGKQTPRWFASSGGIWQPVWLEARPACHVAGIRIEPRLAEEAARVTLRLAVERPGDHVLRLASPDGAFPSTERRLALDPGDRQVVVDLAVPAPRPWSPESPHLYGLDVELAAPDGATDRVATYFGMRAVGRGRPDGRDYEYVTLNGEPIYLRGVLDQAYHPDGLHAYPSDEAIRADVALARELGFNMLRCHLKVNDPRYYYWADRLGLLVMYDLPNFEIDTPSARRAWEATLRGAIERDFNHPSIVAWVLLNETWGLDNHERPDGQAWVRAMYELAKSLDPTRLVEDHSVTNFDHVATDLNSWHFYTNSYAAARTHIEHVVEQTFPGSSFNFVRGYVQEGQPLLNSEYGGVIWGEDVDTSWWKFMTGELRRHPKIGGYVYSELVDVEWEHYGLANYDRTRKEFGYDRFVEGMGLPDLFGADFIGLDAPPCQTLRPGETLAARPFVSHFGAPMAGGAVAWRLDFVDRFGERSTRGSGRLEVRPRRFDVTCLDALSVRLPDEPGLATLAVVLTEAGGRVRCRNYVNAEVCDGAGPRAERAEAGWVLRFAPGAFARSSWPLRALDAHPAKFAGLGSGWVEYELQTPAELDPRTLRRLRLRFEAGARAGLAKVDWRQRARPSDYPQTEERKYPTDLRVVLNGIELGRARLPDDPADARGVLSHHRQYQAGSYGYLVDLELDGAALRERLGEGRRLSIRFEIPDDAEHRGGLALYGETLGAYPLDPTVFLDAD
jgi:hypothetical protein